MPLDLAMIGRRHFLGALAASGAAASTAFGTGPAGAATESFPAWLQRLRREAAQRGIRAATIDAALAGVEPIPRVIELDRRQPEGRLTFEEYRQRVVTQGRIDEGRRHLAENAAVLDQVAASYGVPAKFIVALWGVESSYGRNTGGFPVIAALATLAYDGRRAAFFRSELLNALKILDQGHIPPDRMRGSWAGAMGQNQFMPSSFLSYAVDHDGDGRRDIWETRPDVFASTANYLSRVGWVAGLRWGRAVSVPPRVLTSGLAGKEGRRPLDAWSRLGVRQADGNPLPDADVPAWLVLANRDRGPTFLAYANFDVILRWNRSNYFALAVSEIADALD